MIDDSTGISWESVHKISHSWVEVLIFYLLLFGVMTLLTDIRMIATDMFVFLKGDSGIFSS
jgi:hypothetical protein